MCKHICFTKFDVNTDLQTLYTFVDKTYDNHGFGAILRTLDNRILTLKSLDVTEFYMNLGYVLKTTAVRTLVVHHRTSTNKQGIDYTHPFEYKGNYLTHNGVITVPAKYATKTTNDSEILLHHLIETNYDTKSVSGYFSCFILNDKSTTVLVDRTAPMYTDGRVYCSHNLEGMAAIEAVKVVHGLDGSKSTTPIEITKTNYGQDKAYLSLGNAYSRYSDGWGSSWSHNEYGPWWRTSYNQYADFDDAPSVTSTSATVTMRTNNVEKFLDRLTWYDNQYIAESPKSKALRKRIRKKAKAYDYNFSVNEVDSIVDYFINEYRGTE